MTRLKRDGGRAFPFEVGCISDEIPSRFTRAMESEVFRKSRDFPTWRCVKSARDVVRSHFHPFLLQATVLLYLSVNPEQTISAVLRGSLLSINSIYLYRKQ